MNRLNERWIKGDVLSGKEVAKLTHRQHIFVNGKHSIVVDVNVRGDNVELIYVKGRKKFGREIYMDLKLSDRKTPILLAIPVDPADPETYPAPYAGESVLAEALIDLKLHGELTERTRRDVEMKLAREFSQTELRRLAAMLLALASD